MPMSFTSTAGGTGYVDIRVGNAHNQHQSPIDVSELTSADDADGYLPPGLPLLSDGSPVDGADQTAVYIVGPEAVKLGSVDHFGNAFLDGAFNRDAIEDNLGRSLSANELTALANGGFTLV